MGVSPSRRQTGHDENAVASVIPDLILGDSRMGQPGTWHVPGCHEEAVQLGVGHDIIRHAGVFDHPRIDQIPGAYPNPDREMLDPQAVKRVVTGQDQKASRCRSSRKRRPFQRDIGNVIAIEIAFDPRVPAAERWQGIRCSISIEIIKVDDNEPVTEARVKGDSIGTSRVINSNDGFTE